MRSAVIGVYLILGALQGTLCQKVSVSQPLIVHATQGSSVSLPCSYKLNMMANVKNGSYTFYREITKTGPQVSDSNPDFTGRLSRVSTEEFIRAQTATILLRNIKTSDSGLYFCEVAFQLGSEISAHGNGTFLKVTSAAVPSTSTPAFYTILNVLKVFLGSLVLLAAIFFLCDTQVCSSDYLRVRKSVSDAGNVIVRMSREEDGRP